jgi:hypothetical protein
MESDPYETRDRSAEEPKVVEELKQRYEAWFADVSSTRPNNYAPPLILLGTKQEPTTILTRQEWRGAGWGPLEVGYWQVGVPRPAAFDIKLIFAPDDKRRTAHFRLGETIVIDTVPAKATDVTLSDITLKAGGKLEAWLEGGAQKTGMRFVEITRK